LAYIIIKSNGYMLVKTHCHLLHPKMWTKLQHYFISFKLLWAVYTSCRPKTLSLYRAFHNVLRDYKHL